LWTYLALFPAAAAAACVRFWRPDVRRIAVFAVAWAASEYARGHLFTGFPWNLFGQVWAPTPIAAQPAAWVGVYGLSFLTALLAAAPAAVLTREGAPAFDPARPFRHPASLALIGVAALFVVGGVRAAALSPVDAPTGFVRIVQPNIAQREKWKAELRERNFHRLLDLTAQPNAQPIAAVIWPESATAFVFDRTQWALDAAVRALPKGARLIAGSIRTGETETGETVYYNALHVIGADADGDGRVLASYDKHHLAPFGEFLPLADLLETLGVSALIGVEGGFSRGPGPRTIRVEAAPAFAPLICYESIFPNEIHPRSDRPDWLVVVTNDAWFGDTSGPRQHLDQARLRAIETGLPVARSANTGVSAMIDPFGRVTERLPLYRTGYVDAELPAPVPPTLYSRIGDVGFFVLLAAGAGLAAKRRGGDGRAVRP